MANVFEEKLQVQQIEGRQSRQGSLSQDAFNRRHSLGTGRNSIGRKSFDNANLAMVFPGKEPIPLVLPLRVNLFLADS
jgi:hypothetical protein